MLAVLTQFYYYRICVSSCHLCLSILALIFGIMAGVELKNNGAHLARRGEHAHWGMLLVYTALGLASGPWVLSSIDSFFKALFLGM